ncbi:hypothetical protein CP532_4310 [Ophiocordyceps camponoti-leonardi (nom. inval.)]|nr:hypothetical protein CP532_4310 [Ophiocordyceps camponoti-leonardi (nom. inval.)]
MATVALSRAIQHKTTSDLPHAIKPAHKLEDVGSSPPPHLGPRLPPPTSNLFTVCSTDSVGVDADSLLASPQSLDETRQRSLLYPPEGYVRVDAGRLSIYEITADQIAHALDFAARQPLPPVSSVFPWLHGLNPNNRIQQAFFMSRCRSLRKTPSCLRGVTLVKANGDLSVGRLKGAIAPQDFMRRSAGSAAFIEADPIDGFSVRNFQIQTAKVAFTSDLVIYGDDPVEARRVSWDIAGAQSQWREQHASQGYSLPHYNTFLCTSTVRDFEDNHHDLVSIDSYGKCTGKVLDLAQQERREMWNMTQTSEISHNVFMGPTPEPRSDEEKKFDILIECSDLGRLNPTALRAMAEKTEDQGAQVFIDFPSSGSILPPTWSNDEADSILETCRWMFHLSHGIRANADGCNSRCYGDAPQCERQPSTSKPRKILIHCADGYTESSMLGIAYLSFSIGCPVHEAWLLLHTSKRRNFFAYPTDVALLTALSPRLLQESPTCAGRASADMTKTSNKEPGWLQWLDGSLPSRILDYLYLGNLGHANNPDLLKELGIRQILSVGETVTWRDGELDAWGPENVCVVQEVQDNGVDTLMDQFDRCLQFIGEVATLVHCRVGVSRSATICIAEVMRAYRMTLPRAYCFVRARRLNVIIQPHLQFIYELLKWEEHLRRDGDSESWIKRELEWGEMAREIASMNRPYSR